MTLPAVHLIPLGICLGVAAVRDIAQRKIPNTLTVSVATLGIGVQWWDNGWLAALSGVAAALLTVIVLYRPWLAGGVGGGDVKLAAAVATWIGLGHLTSFALVTALAGGLVAAVCYVLSGREAREQIGGNLVGAALLRELPIIDREAAAVHRRVSVPYGIAIAAGGALALWAPWGL